MPAPLLSTYRGGENRVTASTMAVFERIDLALVQELLGAATGSGDELRTVTFENQVVGKEGVPDARISARFTWWFETKTVRGAYTNEGPNRDQIRRHAAALADDSDARLFVLTPDPARPRWFDQLDGVQETARPRVIWVGFKDLAELMDVVVSDPARLLGERTRFLLAELVALYESDGLLSADDTVVVAARSAWPEYRQLAAYICQPNRTFREGLTHFAFYTDGAIQPLVPRIREHYPAVEFTLDEATTRREDGEVELATLVEALLATNARFHGDFLDVVLLTAADDPQTVVLEAPVVNDVLSESGRPWAWTLGQRYTRLDALQAATTTSDL